MTTEQGAKYFLYIPVWATTRQPSGSGSSSLSSSGSPSSGESETETPGSTETASSSTESTSETASPSGSEPSSSLSSTEGTPTESSGDPSGSSGGSSGGSGGSSGGSGGSSGGPGGSSGGSGGTNPASSDTSSSSSSSSMSDSASESMTFTGSQSSSGGSGSGSSNCLLCGTLVTMADGQRMPIESLQPGDVVRSLSLPGLKIDAPFRAQYEWLSTWGLDGATVRDGRVAEVRHGEHDGFYLINRRIKATFEHPFLVRRDERMGILLCGDVGHRRLPDHSDRRRAGRGANRLDRAD